MVGLIAALGVLPPFYGYIVIILSSFYRTPALFITTYTDITIISCGCPATFFKDRRIKSELNHSEACF